MQFLVNPFVEIPSSLTTQADEQQLHELHASLDEAIAAAERPLAMLRQMCGPELHGEAGKAYATLSQGIGFYRACRDGLASLFRQRNARRRELAEQEEPKPTPECRVGSSIHMSHRMGRDGRCANGCGWEYPSLNLKP